MILNTWLHDTCWWNTSFFDCGTKQTFSFLHFLATEQKGWGKVGDANG